MSGFERYIRERTAAYAAGWDKKSNMVVLNLKARK